MVQYSEAIYNIIRRKIQDIEDVNNEIIDAENE